MSLRTLALVLLALLLRPPGAQARGCEDLASMRFEDGAVTSATTVPAGAFVPPNAPRAPPTYDSGTPRYDYLPSFCRVTAAFTGDLKIEVWAPAEPWSGEFMPQSGGIYGGRIARYGDLASALMTGAATATGNNGNDGVPVVTPGIGASNAGYLREHPEKVAAISGSLHRMVVRSKAILREYYGRPPSLTYMVDRAARDPFLLMQQWPEDLDAVAVTGPILAPTRHVTWQMWVHAATHATPESFIPAEKYPLLHAAVLKACDGLDGARDGILENPLQCRFDPAAVRCPGDDRPDCLTPAQVEAVLRIYSPVKDARTGTVVFPGYPPGGELEWFEVAGPRPYPFAEQFYRELAFGDPTWDWRTRPVNFGADNDLADAPKNQRLDADNPDLRRFVARGGKLLLMVGWADQRISPLAAIDYYRAVLATVGEKAKDHIRLFMVPGMLHYPLGGARASDYSLDTASLLKAWMRTGKAPDQIVGTRYANGREVERRLVCAFPLVAVLNGPGRSDDPANHRCAPQ